MAHTVIATWIQVPRGICRCVWVVRVCAYICHNCARAFACMCENALGDLCVCVCGADRSSWYPGYVSKKESGWEDLLKCAQLCRKQLWHFCWSTANKHPISRSILSLQTLHIFHCVEQYFSMIFCLLCIRNAQSAPNMVCVCHSTCYQIKSFTSPSAVFPKVLLILLLCHFFMFYS